MAVEKWVNKQAADADAADEMNERIESGMFFEIFGIEHRQLLVISKHLGSEVKLS
jgi:hypothetical protein